MDGALALCPPVEALLSLPVPCADPDERLARRWGRVKLPKLGWVRFRWSRPLGGRLRSATVSFDGRHWHVSFLVDDDQPRLAPGPVVGIDRGVKIAATTSDGDFYDRAFITAGEAGRYRRLQQQLARTRKGSRRRKRVVARLGQVMRRVRHRRIDFNAQTSHTLTSRYGTVVLEELKPKNMTASAAGTIEQPGRDVRAKAGLNRAILDKSWYGLERALANAARYTGTTLVKVPAAYTSQTVRPAGAWMRHRVRAKRDSHVPPAAWSLRTWRFTTTAVSGLVDMVLRQCSATACNAASAL
ncbi:transposase [Nonomuraea sp. NPDC049784]|uniref:RNA-guided endonuclease InsQ/TnpB family protein n=1 Tax=Nonomuraea sp. NPDC049784 TaxID=3154361 RepID=UPI0033D64A75